MKYFVKATDLDSVKQTIERLKSMIVKSKKSTEMVDCPRCTGQGGFKHLAHVYGGVCFKCMGSKKVYGGFVTPEQSANNRKIKETIEKYESLYYVTDDFVNEFVDKYTDIDFYKNIDKFANDKFKEDGVNYLQISKSDAIYKINCVLMYQ